MDYAFQLYSARNFQPYADVLQRIAALGYTQVEGFGGVYDDPARFRATMDRHGLTMPSGHFAGSQLETGFDASTANMGPYYLTSLVALIGPARRVNGMAATSETSRVIDLSTTCERPEPLPADLAARLLHDVDSGSRRGPMVG